MQQKKIILASQSPRRKQLLQQAELDFEVIVSHADESFPAFFDSKEIPVFVAKQKGNAVWNTLSEAEQKQALIIACDTIVINDNSILEKPKDANDAKRMLQNLSSKTHQVVSGVYLLSQEKTFSFFDVTQVEFGPLSDQQIEHYISHYKPFDKAGSYAIQEWIGLVGIKKIDGDFYNVMGLPVYKLLQALQHHFHLG